jgi:hypothetical protein
MNKTIYPSKDPSIFELKYPTRDITGRVLWFILYIQPKIPLCINTDGYLNSTLDTMRFLNLKKLTQTPMDLF